MFEFGILWFVSAALVFFIVAFFFTKRGMEEATVLFISVLVGSVIGYPVALLLEKLLSFNPP